MMWTLVTGGSKRLGAEICLSLSAQRLPVLVHYRHSSSEAQHVVELCRKNGGTAEAIHGDFSTLASTKLFTEECLARFPRIKNLINNVGNYSMKTASETTPEEWNDLFQTNLHVPFALCHAFLPSILQSRGSIINIGVVGVNGVKAATERAPYLATKTALWMLTKSLARELAPKHVRVNMVSPGYLENAVDLPKDLSTLPMGRAATCQEVVRAILFLLDESSGYITGQNIEVGGGVGL